MKEFFYANGILLMGIVMVLFASIFFQVTVAWYMIRLAKESEELEDGNIKIMRGWIEEYIKNEKEIINIQVFVDKKIAQFKIGKLTMIQMKHISGQLILFVIFMSGVGVYREIVAGKTLGQVLPFYIICLLGLYIHFLISGFMDMEEKKKCIQRNLVDFFENKKVYLYKNNEIRTQDSIEEIKDIFGEKEEQELKEILREILA